ncbi:alpha/beta hydrolase [Nonomuraea sp. CA-141351]|uniref:alpha/beta hydrolase n=1 Tax=Nonomuraea sp. CA-141351 TaxID=3239996 RepID=UPI003D8E24D8
MTMDAQRVTLVSGGQPMAGRLYPALSADGPAPAVAIIGPMTSVKEQAPMRYAERLAASGFTTLVFDPRYRGESGGEPRNLEDPVAKVADLRAAVEFLAGRPEADADRLAVIGICMGGNTAVHAAADDPGIRAVAAITPHMRNAEADAQWLGGPEAVAARLARGRRALARYEATGEVEYVAAVDKTDPEVGMPGELPWSWYQPQADLGIWENRYAVQSDAVLLTYESLTAAARLTKPFLLIHGDNCALPDQARRHFEAVPAADKVHLRPDTPHLAFYDDPTAIATATGQIVDWFDRHLGPATAR